VRRASGVTQASGSEQRPVSRTSALHRKTLQDAAQQRLPDDRVLCHFFPPPVLVMGDKSLSASFARAETEQAQRPGTRQLRSPVEDSPLRLLASGLPWSRPCSPLTILLQHCGAGGAITRERPLRGESATPAVYRSIRLLSSGIVANRTRFFLRCALMSDVLTVT
jgi:hypothetical protein